VCARATLSHTNVRVVASGAKVHFKMSKSVQFGEEVHLVGSSEPLGSWQISKGQKMKWEDGDVWSLQTELEPGTVEYKYCISRMGDEDIEWMPGENFQLRLGGGFFTVTDHWGKAKESQVCPQDLSDLSKKKVKELKALLSERGLPVSGKKAELIARLNENSKEIV